MGESAGAPAASWTAGLEPRESFPPGFFDRPAEEVAPELLGTRFVSTVGGEPSEGVVVEVEAYVGPHDPACHAAERIGRTARNGTMFGPSGRAYVYLSYGIHWCLNVITREEGYPSGVLIRALDPLGGEAVMLRRRERRPLASGPGRLGQALGLTGALDGHPLDEPPLRLLPGWRVDPGRIHRSPRIGIRKAADWPLRFYVAGNPAVSGRPTG